MVHFPGASAGPVRVRGTVRAWKAPRERSCAEKQGGKQKGMCAEGWGLDRGTEEGSSLQHPHLSLHQHPCLKNDGFQPFPPVNLLPGFIVSKAGPGVQGPHRLPEGSQRQGQKREMNLRIFPQLDPAHPRTEEWTQGQQVLSWTEGERKESIGARGRLPCMWLTQI